MNSDAMVAYKRPQTFSTLLTNYKIIAHKVNVERGISQLCGNCMLCDLDGKDGMTKNTDHIKLKSGKIIKLKKYLNCKNLESMLDSVMSVGVLCWANNNGLFKKMVLNFFW